MRNLMLLLVATAAFQFARAQSSMSEKLHRSKDSTMHVKDSTLHAMFTADSSAIEKEFASRAKWENLESVLVYPFFNGGKYSGVVPVKDPTEIPDPAMEYKLLFEFVAHNPDSLGKEINPGLTEIARRINLHIASGIPVKNLKPVIVVHGPAMHAIMNNEAYQKMFKTDNPNIPLINDMAKMGARFIACGQAMAFFDVPRENLLPLVKVSLTAQTVISGYQLKGYLLEFIDGN